MAKRQTIAINIWHPQQKKVCVKGKTHFALPKIKKSCLRTQADIGYQGILITQTEGGHQDGSIESSADIMPGNCDDSARYFPS